MSITQKENQDTLQQKSRRFDIIGISPKVFLAIALIVLAGAFITFGPENRILLPSGLIGALAISMVLGGILATVGERTPILNSFLGGGAVAVLFGTSALVYFNLMPTATVNLMNEFVKGGGFLNFYIAALIAGSILGMNKKLLIAATARYLPTIIGGVIFAFLFCAIAGMLVGFGWRDAILFIALPIMGGGMGAGAVPIAQIYGQTSGQDPAAFLSIMVPALILGNTVAIIAGGLLDRLGKWKKGLSGEGQLLRNNVSSGMPVDEPQDTTFSLSLLGTGLVLTLALYILGSFINAVLPQIHTFAWMIIAVGIIKVIGCLPHVYEQACKQWYQFVAKHFTWALLACVGVAYIDMSDIINSLTPEYMFLVIVTIIGSIVGSSLIGYLVGFFPIEASITAGLCMANSGGTGDVAVLSASKRMELMPFAAISSRVGGAIMMLIGTLIASILL
ncbi:2-hydroxycarboxylate transporter family protein [Vreelandella sp. EE27]